MSKYIVLFLFIVEYKFFHTELFVTIALVLFGVLDSGIATDDIDNLPSIAYSVFLDRNVDPYYDSYTDRVLHMPMSEVLHLPQVDDPAFFFDMARGIEALPRKLLSRYLFYQVQNFHSDATRTTCIDFLLKLNNPSFHFA
jgi:hypothetical protein